MSETIIQRALRQVQKAIHANQFEQALSLAKAGASTYPNVAHAFYFYVAFALSNLGDAKQALEYQQLALQQMPNEPAYNQNAAVYATTIGTKQMTFRAMLYYQRALHINPDFADALWNYGELLRLEGHIKMAIDCFNRLLAMGKPYPMIYNRLVSCYECLNDVKNTDALYEILLQDKSNAITSWGYSNEQIRRENFAIGFEYYNKRFECSGLNNAYTYPFSVPFWDGTFRPNSTLLIHGEQGLGDEMMFASTFNELLTEAKIVNAKVIIGCKAPVARLFQASFPDAKIFIHSYKKPMDISQLKIDAHLPMGNLLARYRRSIDDFAAHRSPYLHADPIRAAYYNQRIIAMGRESVDGKRRLRVGLMWSTVPSESVDRFVASANRRSIFAELLIPLGELTDEVEYISLQNQDCGEQAAMAPQLQIIDFSLDQADFYDTAALIANLDLVITIDTSVFHLAAAMGKETWVALITYPEWRFGSDSRTESYWYSKTRYFRQSKKDWWPDVIENIKLALKERLTTNASTQSMPHV